MKDYHVIGKNIKRVDAVEKVNGTARYCDDISFRNMLHAKMLHSPYAHARIIKIDTSSAERFPGVHAVITAKDLPENSNLGEEKGWMLAEEEVCYIGDPVAVVAAESLEIADKALKLIEIEYQQLPSVMYLEDALKEDAPLACPGTTTNLLMDAHAVRGDVEQDFSRADVFVSHTVHFPHILQGYLEPNSATAVYVNGELTVHCGSQAWHRLKLKMSPNAAVCQRIRSSCVR